jgi:hypothetical protein
MTEAIIAIDPRPVESAWLVWNGSRVVSFAKEKNKAVLDRLVFLRGNTMACVIEQVTSYGMPVGTEVFETVYWTGRFAEAYGAARVDRVPRLRVKMHLCHDSRAKDGNIRLALIDRFGGKDKAIGRKSTPGQFYGVAGDVWAALALGVSWWDTHGGHGADSTADSLLTA